MTERSDFHKYSIYNLQFSILCLFAAFGPFHPGAFVFLQPLFDDIINRAAIQINLTDHVANRIIINLEITHRLIGAGPIFLAVLPADLFYPAAWFSAVMGLPFINSPAWIVIAFFGVTRKLDPFTLELNRCPVRTVDPAQKRCFALIGGF